MDTYKQQIASTKKYCESLTEYTRRPTRTVTIGDIPLGSAHPIRVQSMTTTDTMDTQATIDQSIRMIDAGCEFVRITAPSLKDAQNLELIKKGLRSQGYDTPLIADIHFTPNAAELAARIVEKVRVNPGNYADKKKFQVLEYSDEQYEAELERIRQKFSPLVNICKEYGTAMRIGTNHGSLSDRIMSRYGDSPLGMVESAMEFLRICEDLNYYNIVLSMKSSNPQVMVEAYRLLVNQMDREDMHYPLHLGVTEAGDGDDGRIKSAIGIGSLLEDGLGDTVRVSLTEEPEFEIPVAQKLVDRYTNRAGHAPINNVLTSEDLGDHFSPFEYDRRHTKAVGNFGEQNVPRVISDFSSQKVVTPFDLKVVGHQYDAALDKWHMTESGCDYLFMGDIALDFMLPNGLKCIYHYDTWQQQTDKTHCYPYLDIDDLTGSHEYHPELNFVGLSLGNVTAQQIKEVAKLPHVVLVVSSNNPHAVSEIRAFSLFLKQQELDIPFVVKTHYNTADREAFVLSCATDIGALLIDGFGDGAFVTAKTIAKPTINNTVFGLLQAARARISKTEYISCPSCGRTLFDLQETTAMIRKRTDHLKGVKIGIMGCIVNGPGEMADADYGYVGTGPGKITLYRSKEVVKKNIDSTYAVDELIELIREDGRWIEK